MSKGPELMSFTLVLAHDLTSDPTFTPALASAPYLQFTSPSSRLVFPAPRLKFPFPLHLTPISFTVLSSLRSRI